MRVDAVRHRPDMKPWKEPTREVHVRRRHAVDVPAQAERESREGKPVLADVLIEQGRRDLGAEQANCRIPGERLERRRHRGVGGEDAVHLHLLLVHPRMPEEFEGEEA